MPDFAYRVRDRQGKVMAGVITADDAHSLRRELDGQGYFIVSFSETKSQAASTLRGFLPFGKVSQRDLAVFCWQLFTMLNAGLPLLRSLKLLERQTKSEKLRRIITEVHDRVEEGNSFSDSLRRHPEAFSDLFVQMVSVGETSGVLDEMVGRLAKYLDRQVERRSQLISALSYPILLATACIGVVGFLLAFVFPRLLVVFEDIGASLPLVTKMMIHLSGFVRGYGLIGLIVAIAAVMGLRVWSMTEKGRLSVDRVKLNLPLFGDLISKMAMSRFAQTFSIMITGGVPILTSLNVVKDTISNAVISKIIGNATENVAEGETLAKPLGEGKFIPEMVVNMVAVGEETGTLGDMLVKVSEFYDREVDNSIKTVTKMVEPLLLIFMALIVGLMAASIFLPIADITTAVRK